MQPNSEKSGSLNPPTNKKIFLSSLKYDLLNKHVKRSDHQMEAVHPVLSGAHPVLSGAHTVLSGAHTVLSGAHTVLCGAHTVLSSVDVFYNKIIAASTIFPCMDN